MTDSLPFSTPVRLKAIFFLLLLSGSAIMSFFIFNGLRQNPLPVPSFGKQGQSSPTSVPKSNPTAKPAKSAKPASSKLSKPTVRKAAPAGSTAPNKNTYQGGFNFDLDDEGKCLNGNYDSESEIGNTESVDLSDSTSIVEHILRNKDGVIYRYIYLAPSSSTLICNRLTDILDEEIEKGSFIVPSNLVNSVGKKLRNACKIHRSTLMGDEKQKYSKRTPQILKDFKSLYSPDKPKAYRASRKNKKVVSFPKDCKS